MKRLATPRPPIAGTLYLILLVDSELIIPTSDVLIPLFVGIRIGHGITVF